jgi:hypothetical protein
MKILKKTLMTARIILILSSILILGCQKEQQFEWDAAMSRPAYYVLGGPHVFYLRQGEIIGSSSTLTDISGNWSDWQSARNSNYSGLLPDSVVVDYGGLNDKLQMIKYRGGMSLPTKELEQMFKEGYLDINGRLQKFRHITTGMAPGGRICVWVDHVEIKRGVVESKDIYLSHPGIIFEDSLEINNYLKHHPVDYRIWEQSDPRYELDFGFCSEDGLSALYHSYFVSKEGIAQGIFKRSFEKTIFDLPYGEPSSNDLKIGYIQKGENYDNKLHLPVHCKIEWINLQRDTLYYSTDVPLPKNLRDQFIKSYKNPKTGQKSNYNRLVFGVEKGGEYCIIWLDGPDKQKKLVRFKGKLGIMKENGLHTGGYATDIIYYD